jgi:hypothetical protein
MNNSFSISPKSGADIVASQPSLDKKWYQKTPLSRSWREERKMCKTIAKLPAINSPCGKVLQEVYQSESSQSAPSQPEPSHWQATQLISYYQTLYAPQPKEITAQAVGNPARNEKILAHYPHHDNKGAVGYQSTTSSSRSYPYKEYVGGKRVLASYGHHDDK